jgi:LPS-assembly protein
VPSPPVSAPPQVKPAPVGREFIELKSADQVRYEVERRTVRASGNVRFAYDDVEVACDEMVANLEENTAALSGRVVLRAKGEELHGATLLVRLDTRQWELAPAKAAISPHYFERGVLSPLYVGAREVQGLADRLVVRGATFTTCDLPHPHYEIVARRLRIWPGRKLIADHAAVFILGKHIFTLPWFLVSLREPQRQPIVPQLGQNEFEGYYLKTLVNYVINPNSYGAAHLDLMSRRGFGKGIEHTEVYPTGRSSIYVYQVNNTTTGADELTARGQLEQTFRGGLALRAAADFRSDNYYYLSGSQVLNSQLGLTRGRASSNTSLAFDYNRTSGAFDSSRFSANLRHDERGPRYGWSLDSTYDDHGTFGGATNDQELNNRLQITDHESRMDARLLVTKRFDPDGDAFTGDDFYQVVDHLPELMLETDTYRLRARPLGLPARMTFSVGNFSEQPTLLQAYRIFFGYDGIPKTIKLGPTTRFNAQARFQQYLYGDRDHTAQYVYGGNLRLEQDLGADVKARLGYVLSEPKGYTPFRFDYVGAYRTAAFDLVYRHGDRARALLRTGYDARFSRWQDILARLDVPLAPTVQFGLSGAYDANRGLPRDLLTTLRFGDRRTALELSTDYQPQTGRLQRATTYLDWVANPRWRVQLLTGYDGAQHRWQWGEVLLTRSLHCWEVSAYYSLQRNLFRLDFRIKAFDWGKPDFGVGRYGQYLDTSIPEWY